MGSLLHETGTPCPSRRKASSSYHSNEEGSMLDSSWENDSIFPDDTCNLEFTTELRAPVLIGAKPRRANRSGSSFQIHEENAETKERPIVKRRRENVSTVAPSNRKASLLAQPAQRFRPRVNFALSPSPKALRQQAKPRTTIQRELPGDEGNNTLLPQINGDKQEGCENDALKKDVRRNTVYIPPDDTTVASVFMGLFSPLKSQRSDGTSYQVPEDTQIHSLEARIARKREARKSLATSARRAPLQQSSKLLQEKTIHVDIPGKNGGKENTPPGSLLADDQNKNCKKELDLCDPTLKSKPKTSRGTDASTLTNAQSLNGLASSNTARQVLGAKTTNAPRPKRTALSDKQSKGLSALDHRRGNYKPGRPKSMPANERSPISRGSISSERSRLSRASNAPLKHSIPNGKQKTLNVKFPLLAEDISNPAMYEDNWLAHQEIIITQLVNRLFDYSDGNQGICDPDILRHELLGLYQNEVFGLLYRRIQASVLYGALSVPKDVLARNGRFRQDLGLKRKFLDLWVNTYDLSALRAAAETVVGRRIPIDFMSSQTEAGAAQQETVRASEKILRKKLEAFLDTFLLQNEDMDHVHEEIQEVHANAAGWAYQRTVLRSILMAVLLDRAKLCSGTMLPMRLFAPSSPYKSTTAVLQALGRLLLPSCGDIIRSLGYLDCQVSYEQHPLQDYEYRIDNLAVDLRDGVRLTRMVELLLYPSTFCSIKAAPEPDVSETVTLPTGENLLLLDDRDKWPLSQHLKLPCASRAAKIFNVQVALSALGNTKGVFSALSTSRAEDIVDGHREKTIALLWGLVSKWGLSALVDWDDLRKEIDHLKRKAVLQFGYDQVKDEAWFNGQGNEDEQGDGHASLLKRWASILAQLKGLHLENLTTSFADGRIYEAIVDEYEGYIVSDVQVKGKLKSKGPVTKSLESRLRSLGCSSQFAYLVSPTTSASSHIFDCDFTLASLAFLCSRLLSASKRVRAATVLQSAWRRILARRDLHRRAVAGSIARQCAAVVQTRDRILWAKEVIVRSWRLSRVRKQQRAARTKIRHGKKVHPLTKDRQAGRLRR